LELETGNINKAYTMTATERKKLQRDFLRRVGPNAETFKALFDTLPDATFYMMDDQDRIMAYNRRNCENSNIRSEAEIVGKKSSEVFPAVLAEACGFYDQSHFIRTFKRLRRQTPAQYRRAHFSA